MQTISNKSVGFSTNNATNPHAMTGSYADSHFASRHTNIMYEISSIITTHSAWKAFQAGLNILQQYARRSRIDVQGITKSNLKLLHHSLIQDENFIRLVKMSKHGNLKNHLPDLQHLYTEQGAWSEFITLQDGNSISLSGSSGTNTMYLLLSGCANLKKAEDARNRGQRWRNILGRLRAKSTLHSGSVVTIGNRLVQQYDDVLTAFGENCLILRVQIPPTAGAA